MAPGAQEVVEVVEVFEGRGPGAVCRKALKEIQNISAEFRGQRRKASPQEEVIEESRAGWHTRT